MCKRLAWRLVVAAISAVGFSSAVSAQNQNYTGQPQQRAPQGYPQQQVAPQRQVAPPAGQRTNVQAVGRTAPNSGVPAAATAPFQVSQEEARYIDQLLMHWEKRSDVIQRYRCKFTRWEYDTKYGPAQRNPQTGEPYPKSVEHGEIKYEKPDKGLFKVNEVLRAKLDPKTNAIQYAKIQGETTEQWICDGKTIFEFDGLQKRLVERPLPPEMQGKAISDGPLPFLFGAKANTIKERYWLRIKTPQQLTNKEYWLEAWPKRQQDAANFRKILILIDTQEFLPYAIRVYPPGEQNDVSNTTYQFTDRKINETNLLPFQRSFYRPAVPSGWKRHVENFGPSQPTQQQEGIRNAQVPKSGFVNPFRSIFGGRQQR